MGISRQTQPRFPAGVVGALTTNDFDEMCAAPPAWEQRYQQFGNGPFTGKLFLAHTARLQIGVASWHPGIMIQGTVPAGCTFLAVPLSGAKACVQRDVAFDDDRVLVLHHGEPVDVRATAGCEFFMVAADTNQIEEHAQVILGRPLEELRKNHVVALDDPAETRAQLAALAHSLQLRLLHDAAPLTRPQSAHALETDLLDQILSRVRAPQIVINNSYRRALAWEVEDYLRAHIRDTISIFDLCNEVGAAERTLHLAFREVFGTTPKAYLKMLRLNAVRHDLRHAGEQVTVTDVACRWDFLHFGWFSHDYRKMFGTSPSAAIRAAH
jgi:AraC family ethanolamine operon transcriptional activator